jgi:hypothetical protein
MPTISTYVDVDVDLDDFDTGELVEELESRGYYVSDDPVPEMDALDKYEIDWLLELVDKNNKDVYTNRVRDKLHNLRWNPR